MTRLLLSLPAVALAAACATTQPYAPVRDVRYQALGAEPFWLLTIGDDRIVLRVPGDGETTWPRTLPRTEGDLRVWQAGEREGMIVVEARRGPCETEGEEVYADRVRILWDGRELTGCGGRLIRRAPQ